mmetsp:Transcript_59703/g.132991  ORF Transcript_59703/g.132991 Transcript_59703/m.132991 type:complete len:250 (-) Transcript_59703:1156-1905(-)
MRPMNCSYSNALNVLRASSSSLDAPSSFELTTVPPEATTPPPSHLLTPPFPTPASQPWMLESLLLDAPSALAAVTSPFLQRTTWLDGSSHASCGTCCGAHEARGRAARHCSLAPAPVASSKPSRMPLPGSVSLAVGGPAPLLLLASPSAINLTASALPLPSHSPVPLGRSLFGRVDAGDSPVGGITGTSVGVSVLGTTPCNADNRDGAGGGGSGSGGGGRSVAGWRGPPSWGIRSAGAACAAEFDMRLR